jgi:chromosome segregation ATPase
VSGSPLLSQVLAKLEACQDEVGELSTENRDVKASNDRIDALNDELREAVTRLTEEKKALESTRESLKDAIEDMQTSAKTGTEGADVCLVELGRDFERARAKLGQLRTSFDGRSVIDDVVCLQHVCKLLCGELEGSVSSSKEAVAQLSDWRTRHATKTTEHAELARVHSDVTSTKEQLLARNEELEAEAERLRKVKKKSKEEDLLED